VVTGQVPSSPASTAKAAGQSAEPKQAYFVLDTRPGEVEVGLSEADWNERLKRLGITAAPSLNPPLLPR
jgi:hypothetical protein